MRVRKRITRYSTLILINRVRLPSYRSPPLPRPLRTRCILHCSSVPCKTKEKTAFKLRSLSVLSISMYEYRILHVRVYVYVYMYMMNRTPYYYLVPPDRIRYRYITKVQYTCRSFFHIALFVTVLTPCSAPGNTVPTSRFARAGQNGKEIARFRAAAQLR